VLIHLTGSNQSHPEQEGTTWLRPILSERVAGCQPQGIERRLESAPTCERSTKSKLAV
jgi:hypothetical protein